MRRFGENLSADISVRWYRIGGPLIVSCRELGRHQWSKISEWPKQWGGGRAPRAVMTGRLCPLNLMKFSTQLIVDYNALFCLDISATKYQLIYFPCYSEMVCLFAILVTGSLFFKMLTRVHYWHVHLYCIGLCANAMPLRVQFETNPINFKVIASRH